MTDTPLTDETKVDPDASDVTPENPLTDGVKPTDGEGDGKGEPSPTDPDNPSPTDGPADEDGEVTGAPESYEAFTAQDGMELVPEEVEKLMKDKEKALAAGDTNRARDIRKLLRKLDYKRYKE